MNRIEDKYGAFKNRMEDVVRFLDFIEMQKNEIKDSENIKLVGEVMKSFIPYNALIISMYGNIELFIDEVAEVYIDQLYKLTGEYAKLPEKMREKHEMTTGEYLYNPGRFNNWDMTRADVICNLNDCLQGKENAKINIKMLLKHSGNLRSDQIFRFFNELGVEGIKQKFLQNEITISTYAEQKEISLEDSKARLSSMIQEQEMVNFFEELDDLVEQRNQVAHSGKVDEKKALNYIKENTVPFIFLFGKVISEILINEIIRLMIEKDILPEFHEIKKIFNNKIIWLNPENITLAVGDEIAITNGATIIGRRKITSIMVDDKDVSIVESADAKDVTICVDKKVKENWNFYKLTLQS